MNFALICATHRNLTQRVSAGEFREDLLWRLREYALALPPLREWPALETFIATLWHDLGGASRRVTLSNALLVHLEPAAVAGKRTPAAERPEGNAGSRR